MDALNEILASPEFGQFTETFVLKNAPSHEVQEKMETVLAAASKDDLVLIYFSGHGKQMDRSYQLCLATANTRLKALATTSIPAATIKLLFDHSFAKSKILILDCCYSGAVEKAFKGGGIEEELKRMSEAEGTFIMAASTDFQVAVERPEDQLSLFTKHLVEGIRSGEADKNEDGLIDINELHSYVCEKVRQEGTQKPLEWHMRSNGDLILSRSSKNAKEKWRQEIERSLHRFAADGLLTSKIVHEAIQVLHVPKKTLTSRERQSIALIEQLIGSKIGTGAFIEQWIEMRFLVSRPKQGDIMRDEITGMELVYIPAGCFMMGSLPIEEGRDNDEVPVHEVCVDALWIGKYQVTQEQWQKIMGSNPAKFQNGNDYPVEMVSWDQAQAFIVKLNKQSGKKYRLPTEAEWEYACWAGGSEKYDLDAVAWYDKKNSSDGTHPVGEKKGNAFGLHDMLGNVWEWCGDWYGTDYYAYICL